MKYREASFWFDSLGAEPVPRAPLPGDLDVDVVILGAGFTGLWTAYYLTLADPSCRVALVERDIAGFGASGRNGGWCAAMLQGLDRFCERDPKAGAALREAMVETVHEVGSVCQTEGIQADYHLGGGYSIAADAIQAVRLRREFEYGRKVIGWTENDVQWLEPEELSKRMRVASCHGAIYNPGTAALNPAKLARGLAEAVERGGATIYEQTTVTGYEKGLARTDRGTIRAERIVVALNAHVSRLPGAGRHVVPFYNHMIATEPLSQAQWDEIGLAPRGLFGDFRRLFFYAQRTADDRIAIGGRTSNYYYGNRIDRRFERHEASFRKIHSGLLEMLPQLADVEITHRWGGVLGMQRDMAAAVLYNEAEGIAQVRSYMGEGVTASNLAGRTICDLVRGEKTPRVSFPWVEHHSRPWEPEPLRWIGFNAGEKLCHSADESETKSGRPARIRSKILETIGVW